MKKTKKALALVLAASMTLALAGCGGSKTTATDPTTAPEATKAPEVTAEATKAPTEEPTTGANLEDIIPAETVTLNLFSQLANYEGEQVGWFAKLMLDKFNVKLNIINNGDGGVFATRMESGDLGDIVIFGDDSDEYKQAAEKGMLFDWEDEDLVATWGSFIAENMATALEKNKNITGTLYGFGYDVATSSGDFTDFDYHPDIRWDLYQAVGSPEINTLEDYIGVLKAMKEIEPTSDSGKETYGVSLFNDWDGNMVMFVKATATNFFGVDEFHFGFYNADDGSFQACLDETGYYKRCLTFYNKLYQEGLLDPDSMTQGYSGTNEDYMDGGAFFCIFGWMGAPAFNTNEHMDAGKQMLPVAAKDQDTLVYGLNPAGGNRVWTIGAKTQYPELCMAIINWLSTPEGNLTQLYGPQGICWDYQADGTVDLTDFGLKCKMESNVTMPAPYDGYFVDGQQQYNNTTWQLNTQILGSTSGQTYNYLYWPKYLSLPTTSAMDSWKQATGTDTFKEYLSQFTYSVSKANTYSQTVRTEELDTTWKQVAEAIKNGSWEAIYAKDDAEFEAIWTKMVEDAKGYGYDACIEWCVGEAALRKAAEIN